MRLFRSANSVHHETSVTVSGDVADEGQQRSEVELIPGTEILSSSEDRNLVRGEKGGYEGMVLIPQPSEDPHDPLVSCTLHGKTSTTYTS